MHSLAAVDLNLVVALHALLEERSVTAAARRVGLSQPATSHALARLREHFGDPLLIRAGRAMTPTPRALALLEQARPVVRQLEALMAAAPPAPEDLELRVRVVTDDYLGCTLLPALVARLEREAPGVTLDVLQRGLPGRKRLLRQGQADLALGYFSGAGMDLMRQGLFQERWVCALRAGHPALEGPWTPEVWAGLRHVIVSPTGGRRGAVDRLLEERGLARDVALAVPHFTAALAVAAASDLVVTTAASLAEGWGGALALLAPPLAMADFEVAMLWHPRTEHDPAHAWFRGRVAQLAEERPQDA